MMKEKNLKIRVLSDMKSKVSDTVTITCTGYITLENDQIADILRDIVRGHCDEDDAGCDYFYDEVLGVICIAETPGWWDSRDPELIELLKIADKIDGNDFSFSYEKTLSNTDILSGRIRKRLRKQKAA